MSKRLLSFVFHILAFAVKAVLANQSDHVPLIVVAAPVCVDEPNQPIDKFVCVPHVVNCVANVPAAIE